jgi:RNA polymerase sporulation-specific sigma factor
VQRRALQTSRPDAAALDQLTDVELVARAQDGCADSLAALIDRYRRFARAKARGYFLVGADADDVEQEALIGIYKAARDFRPEHLASFRAFADLCVTRQIITAIKSATRQKQQSLNLYVSISSERSSDVDHSSDQRPVDELIHLHRHHADPAERIVAAERFDAMRERLSEVLSGLEVDVLALYVEGRSYHEISDELGRHVKAIDNALQRIKRKLELTLDERAAADAVDDLALIA